MTNHQPISDPELRIDAWRAKRNIRRMAEKATAGGHTLRPHFKTHQSLEVAAWFRAHGLTSCTVSSPTMAAHFAHGGWDDITIAFPAQPGACSTFNEISHRCQLGVIGDSIEAIKALDQQLDRPIRFWIEIDTGYGRTGIPWENQQQLTTIARAAEASRMLDLVGLLGHAGDSYSYRGSDALRKHGQLNISRLTSARDICAQAISRPLLTSYGDTPTCSACDTFLGIDELRPGNFIYYDLAQEEIGSCSLDDIAITVACPVVATNPEKQQVVIHGGGVHLSKDQLSDGSYGRILAPKQNPQQKHQTIPGVKLTSLSQEHGIIHAPADWIQSLHIGDVLEVLPVHSCLTVACCQHPLHSSSTHSDET